MKAAGILPFFTGIAAHAAWAPYGTFENVAGQALCGAHYPGSSSRSPRPARTSTRPRRSRPSKRCSP